MKDKLEPLNSTQADYIKSIDKNVVSVALGLAGTGKTYIAASKAAEFLEKNSKGNIVLCRPNVSDSKTIGLLKGTLEEKMESWTVPYTTVLKKKMEGMYEGYVGAGRITVVPFEYMQGLTWDDSFVLLDEAQHTSPKEMEMFLKRVGIGSKVIISGDLEQSNRGHSSGLADLLKLCNDEPQLQDYIGITEFNDTDVIVRSEFCREITLAYRSRPKPIMIMGRCT